LGKEIDIDTRAVLEGFATSMKKKISGIATGEKCSDIKEKQKIALEVEYNLNR
jgi:hypothetical protein